jgi:ATP-dependent DNA helicase DinG
VIAFNDKGLDAAAILGEGGMIAESYAPFEARPQQVQMAAAVSAAFNQKRKLVVEAGTGVGKSFAYLIPAIDQVVRKKGKALISTYTITLQEQLINKDIPFLINILETRFTACLAKGRNNYVCMRRLKFALQHERNLFDADGLMLTQLHQWALSTKNGSLSDVPFAPTAAAWDKVKSEHGNCRGRKCSSYGECFYWRARRELNGADIIVANHAMLFSDLILKADGASLLPDYNFIVIDEAHNLEQAAEDHFGIDISNHSVSFLLNGLYNPRTHKGILAYSGESKTVGLVKKCSDAAKNFFCGVEAWYEAAKEDTNGRTHAGFIDDSLSEPVRNLRLGLTKLANASKDEDFKFELLAGADRCRGLEDDIESFLRHSRPANVYWVEAQENRKKTIRLKSAPLNVGPDVKRVLFDEYESVALTSATLSSDGGAAKGGFGFFASRVGLEDFDQLKLGSPFDYEKNVTIYIEPDLPEPTEKDFEQAAAQTIKKYVRLTNGKAFILFTSYTMLNKMAELLSEWLDEQNIKLLKQGGGADRSRLLHEFKSGPASVLFGTDSFWQGVDVPGEALSNVIIVRLPFAVPNHPLLQGRLEEIKQNGGNPFFDYQLPSAIIKFKQGFGRLIRTKTDSGIVVILDSRIVRKPYGKQFLSAIPKCKINTVFMKK